LRERLLEELEREPEELRREPPERDDEPREDDEEPLPLRLELLRLREPLELLRLRDDDPDDDELDRRDDDERRRVADLRSAAGISSCATAFVSCGISFARNFAMRSSSRRMPRAIFAVSLSPTTSASVSIAV
jgi:hypothetical protein